MLEIRPLSDDNEKVDSCTLCNIVFDPDLMYYGAFADGTLVGICAFIIKDDCGILSFLNSCSRCDDQTLFVLGRAVLNFILLCGINTAVYNADNKLLAKSIGFEYKNGIYSVDTNLLFSSECK